MQLNVFFKGVTAMLVVYWVGGWVSEGGVGGAGGGEVKAALLTPHKIPVFDSAFFSPREKEVCSGSSGDAVFPLRGSFTGRPFD